MSWSFHAVGKPPAIIKEMARQMASIRCAEPEDSIRNLAIAAVQKALEAFPDASAVRVEASGSQTQGRERDKFTNSLKIVIEPLYGFVE